MADSFYFDSLPEELQLQICACLASSCDFAEIHRFRTVSKTTKRLCEDRQVLSAASLELPNFTWHSNPWIRCWNLNQNFNQIYNNYEQKCCDAGNPLAVYRVGLAQYFAPTSDNQQRDEGLRRLAQASEMGINAATQIYGLILICLGGENKQTGLQILSPLTFSLTEANVVEMESYWDSRRDNIIWSFGKSMMLHLKRSYVKENCTCDGTTTLWFAKAWGKWGIFSGQEDMPTSMVCGTCLWDQVLQVFFKFYEG